MASENLAQAIEAFDMEWLFAFFEGAAHRPMRFLDKAGRLHTLPPAETPDDARTLATTMLEKLRRYRKKFETLEAPGAMWQWRNVRVDWFRKYSRRHRGVQALEEAMGPHTVRPAQRPDRSSPAFPVALAASRAVHQTLDLRLVFEALRARCTTQALRQGVDALERYYFGEPYAEQAAALGVPAGTLKSHAFCALQHFRPLLRQELGGT